MGNFIRRQAFIHIQQRLIVDELVHRRGFLQNFVDFLIPPVRPVMRLKQHFGLAAEQRPGLRDRKRPRIAVADLRAAQRI